MVLTGCTRLFFQPSQTLALDPHELGLDYRDVYFASADGTMLHGWWLRAHTSTVKGTFVQFHGNAENISTHFRSLVWVMAHGYHLFTFDYRGYGRSEGQASMKGVHGDILAAIAQARNLEASGGEQRLILYGQSLGGTLLLHVAGTMQDRRHIAVVIVDSAFSSYQAIAREKLAGSWITFLFQPLAYVLVSDRYAPQDVLGQVSPIPLLVIHGEGDDIVPVHHGERIYERAKPPKWLWKLPGVGHIQAMSPQHRPYRHALLDFLDRLANAPQRAPSP